MAEFTQHPQSLAEGLVLVFALLIGHMLADYPLQGDFLAVHKNRHVSRAGSSVFPEKLWIHCLLAHSFIHAGVVWLISGRVIFGIAEMVLHFVLDYIKCENWTSYTTDQVLHAVCKVCYVALLLLAWVK